MTKFPDLGLYRSSFKAVSIKQSKPTQISGIEAQVTKKHAPFIGYERVVQPEKLSG